MNHLKYSIFKFENAFFMLKRSLPISSDPILFSYLILLTINLHIDSEKAIGSSILNPSINKA